MPTIRRMILGHVLSGMGAKMNRTKKFKGDIMETPLNRCLSTFDITLLGVGHMVGAGIYVLTGTVARDIAGPGVIFSFLLAGMASQLAALCYAEFGAKIPKAGSAYVYTYVTIGEFWAFVIGWNIILEHMLGAASVARAWSGYVDSLSGGTVSNFTSYISHGIGSVLPFVSQDLDPLAASLCIIYSMLMGLGVKNSTAVNSFLTIVNLSVMICVIGLGTYYADISNWSNVQGGFLPFGFKGVLAGAATCFYAFIGFESIATSGEEAKEPGRSIPLATAISMAIVTFGYVLVSGALTLVVPYWKINPTAALPEAFAAKGLLWAKYIISIGALCGMTTTLFGSLFSLPRTIYAIANDGLLFSFLGRVNEHTQVPVANLIICGTVSALIAFFINLRTLVEFMSIGTFLAYTIVSASIIILRYRPEKPVLSISSASSTSLPSPPTEGADSSDANSITIAESELLDYCEGPGKLRSRYIWLGKFVGNCEPCTAVVISVLIYVCACITFCILIFAQPDYKVGSNWWDYFIYLFFLIIMSTCLLLISAHRQIPMTDHFRVPWVPLLPAMSILVNIGLMFHLSIHTWLRFFVWMILGMMIYFLYGIHYSKENLTTSSYSILMATTEANRGAKWGATLKATQKTSKDSILTDEGY